MNAPEINGFEVIEKIGEGGMATVWKARQVSLDRIVAIKILLSKMERASEDAERFQGEARSAAKLKHPGIVQVHDAGTEKGHFYFVMEYVAGYTVGDWIRRKGRLSEEEALVVAECVADALKYAWTTEGMVHCDIKPDNVIIDADGTVKIADLGLARTINSLGAAELADEVMGTPAYISPEQAEGKVDLDCRSDIYSLGAMLYHMVTGKLMFEGHSEETVMEMQVTTDPEDPKTLNPELTDGMHRLLMSMLAKDPALRPADWNEVVERLAEVREQLTVKSGGHAPVKKIRINHERLAKMASRIEQGRDMRETSRPVGMAIGLVVLVILALVLRQQWGGRNRNPARTMPSRALSGQPSASGEARATGARMAEPETEKVREPSAGVPEDGASDAVVQAPALPSPEASDEDPAAEMLAFARRWATEHPDQLPEAIRRFERVAEDTRGTKYALMADDEIHRLEEGLQAAKDRVMEALEAQANAAVEADDLLKAAEIHESYDGALSAETEAERAAAAQALRRRYREQRMEETFAEKRSEMKMRRVLRELADRLLLEGVPPALEMCRELAQDPALEPDRDTLQSMVVLLEKAASVNRRILDSFREQEGVEVTVDFVQGPQTLQIVDVQGDSIIGRREFRTGGGIASSEQVFCVGDLSAREKMFRMGADEEPDVALLKGLMAYRSKSYTHARRFFGLVGTPLAKELVLCVDRAEHPDLPPDRPNRFGTF